MQIELDANGIDECKLEVSIHLYYKEQLSWDNNDLKCKHCNLDFIV